MSSLKMLIEKARNHYARMEEIRNTSQLFALASVLYTPGSKLFVLDQLLAQYEDNPSNPKYIYKDRKPEQTADEVVLEIITRDLEQGIINLNDSTPMKMSLNDSSAAGAMQTILHILSHCYLAQLGHESPAYARKKITMQHSDHYKAKMSHVDKEQEFLALSHEFINECENKKLAEKTQALAEIQAMQEQYEQQIIAMGRETAELRHQILQDQTEITELNIDGQSLALDAEEESNRLESTLHDLQERAKAEIKKANLAYNALEFRYTANHAALVRQKSDYEEIISRCEELQTLLLKATAQLDQAHKDNSGLNNEVEERRIIQERLHKQIESLNVKINGLQTTVAELNSELAQKDLDMTSKDQLLNLAAEESAESYAKITSTKQELEESHANNELLKAEMQQLQEQLALKTRELAERNSLVGQPTAKEKSQAAEIARLKEANQQLKLKLEKNVTVSAKAQSLSQQSQETIAQQQREIAALTAANATLEAQVSELVDDLNKPEIKAASPLQSPRQVDETYTSLLVSDITETMGNQSFASNPQTSFNQKNRKLQDQKRALDAAATASNTSTNTIATRRGR